ncbi:alpha/beta fold hydrolase [Solimonas sp. K1W22B-7]|uniref:haloalkane dehalogenase n=1 Tax=Solimonas sp. K1W22B-7 TaxID=2303331 RepID=UPI000E32DBD0|nr:haloalkane dehalogenase [Solimonas sp. K1W22B-7]AXQ27403.1 alpha/beta fold hydrolase [Solimonas sp. K1W22B-7]
MKVFRTPEARFADLPGYPFKPHYQLLDDGLRMHYVDEGSAAAPPVLMLHGEPSWSYLYRKMIPLFAQAGYRALAPDLVGFGKSDKPLEPELFSYQAHVEWLTQWIVKLDLRDITLVCQDWGALLGLRIAMEQPERFARVVVANGFLPTGDRAPPAAFKLWRGFAQHSPWFPIGRIVAAGCSSKLPPAVLAAYDAPFATTASKTAARCFPALVPTTPSDPATPANRRAWEALGQWQKPFLTVFGGRDAISRGADRVLQKQVPGAQGQPHETIAAAGHFIQEDAGEELAGKILGWMRR